MSKKAAARKGPENNPNSEQHTLDPEQFPEPSKAVKDAAQRLRKADDDFNAAKAAQKAAKAEVIRILGEEIREAEEAGKEPVDRVKVSTSEGRSKWLIYTRDANVHYEDVKDAKDAKD